MILVGSHDKVEDGEEIDLVTKNAMMVMAMLKKIMIVRLGDGPATPSKRQLLFPLIALNLENINFKRQKMIIIKEPDQ